MAHQYYSEATPDSDFYAGSLINLSGSEAHHAAVVARLEVGEGTRISNGMGSWATGVVESVSKKHVAIKLTETFYDETPATSFTLIQASAKGDRTERALEQATEFGYDSFLVWEAKRSIVKRTDEKKSKSLTKWERIVREASKQCLRSYIPNCGFVKAKGISEIIETVDTVVYVLDPQAENSLSKTLELDLAAKKTKRVFFIVGPEGGITDEEIESFERSGAKTVRLGETVLRTSSAGVAAISVAKTVLGHW